MSYDLNKFGLHYFHDELHYTQAYWTDLGSRISALGAGWLTLAASDKRAIPETFLRSVIDAGIRPIVHIHAKIGTISLREIAPILKSYADWGVRHVVVYDRPNLQSSWNQADWSRGELLDRFTDQILPLLHVEREVGLEPMLPPLDPGGDYWDTAFLEALLTVIERRNQSDLLKEMGYSLYAWTHGRPLDWGKGGPDAWPDAKPYHHPEDSEDHIGFRIYEWYQAIIQRLTGAEAPLYVLAGGYTYGVHSKREDPIDLQCQIYEFLGSNDAPDYLRCFNFEAFQADENVFSNWFDANLHFGVMANAIQECQRAQRKTAYAGIKKPIDHYALLPSTGTQHALEIWQNAAPFAIAAQPAVGFSIEEALYARKVTILASENEIPLEAEQRLEDSGSLVTRIDPRKDKKLLESIAAFTAQKDKAGGEND